MKKRNHAGNVCKASERSINFAETPLDTPSNLSKGVCKDKQTTSKSRLKPPVCTPLKELNRDDKKNRKVHNSMNSNDKQQNTKINSNNSNLKQKLLFAHNIGWKFPLKNSCKIPFNKDLKKVGLKNNSQYLLSSKNGFLKQTTKNLIVYPKQLPGPLEVGSAKQLLAQSRAVAIAWVKSLQVRHIGLRVFAPLQEPITKEFAVKDSFAEKVKFTFRASNGVKIDKSVHEDESGHRCSGKELDFVTVEQADEYCNLPNNFKTMTEVFIKSLRSYNTNIELHLSTLQDMKEALKQIALNNKPIKTRLFRGSAKRSATYKGCS